MKYFTISELCHSDTAITRGIDNSPTAEVIYNLTKLTDMCLDPIREKWGRPIRVTSGYRSRILNRSVNGATSSQHLRGQAADLSVGGPSENKKLFDMIVASGIEFDQILDEYGYKWIHISYNEGKNRKQILHIK